MEKAGQDPKVSELFRNICQFPSNKYIAQYTDTILYKLVVSGSKDAIAALLERSSVTSQS